MSSKVFEEAPQAPQPSGGAIDKIRKAARQLAYDTRYKVKQKFKDGQKTDPASLKRAYIQQLGSSSAPGPVKALAKKMLIGEEYDFVSIDENVESSFSNVISRVFVEGGGRKKEVEEVQEAADTRYVIRVTDKKTGKSYLRKATDSKIAELRKNPNIRSVEKTGRSDEGTYDRTGQKTAKVKAGKGLDPVGQEDSDVDNDGKKNTKSDKYILNRRDTIGRAIAKEEVIYEKEEGSEKKLDVMKGKNKVNVNPTIGEQIKAELAAISQKKIEETAQAQVMQAQKKAQKAQKAAMDAEIRSMQAQKRAMREECDTCEECGKSPCKCEKKEGEVAPMDPREVRTRINLAKNKLRSMGLKMSYDMEGELVDEAKVDKLLPDYKRSAARNARYDNPDGALALGGGIQRSRRAAHRERDEMNKDKKDVRRGKTGGPQFQGKTGAERLAKVKSELGEGKEELSVDQQMKISQQYNRMSPEEKRAANKKAMGNVKKVAPKKDTRTDAQKMTDATGPRPGSRYRGD
jgi:hypothetical protein